MATSSGNKDQEVRREATLRLKEARRLLRRARGDLGADTVRGIEDDVETLAAALAAGAVGKIAKASARLGGSVDQHLSGFRKATWRESVEGIGFAVTVALLLRAFVVEAFKIPSGSMIPTLSIGDQIFVNKLLYGVRIPFTSIRLVDFSEPERGDVIVFICPEPPHQDYIKRVVALPGDEVEVRNGQLRLNGEAIPRRLVGPVGYPDRDNGRWWTLRAVEFEETLSSENFRVLRDPNSPGAHRDFGPMIIPEDTVFVMGDNRDHSSDSRAWGVVPMSSVLGKAMFVWWSWGSEGLAGERLGTWIE